MEKWSYAKIGDVCTVERGGSPRPIDKFITDDPNGINWIKIGDTTDSMYITETAQKIIPEGMKKSRYVQPGDFLLSNSMSFGRPYILKIDGCIHDGWLVLRDNDCVFDKRFLYYYLSSPSTYQKFKNMAVGGVVNNLNSDMVRGVTVPVPKMEEQIEIVQTLDNVSKLISLRKQQLEKLDQLVKSRFIELFGDPKLNDKGWKSGVVSDYFEVKGGKRIPKGMGYSDSKTRHPYLRATDMKNETIVEDDIHYIDEEVFQHIKRYTVKGGDIYLTNVGVNLGMAGVIPQKFDGASLTENAVKLVPKTQKVFDGLFLAHYINSPGIQEYIKERKMSVGVPKLAIFRIETMPLLMPPMDVQQKFNTFVEQVDKSKLTIQASLDKLEVMKKALMQKYFE